MKEKDLQFDCTYLYCNKKTTYDLYDKNGDIICSTCKAHINIMINYYEDIFDHVEKVKKEY
jgi:hypothetical protein